MYERKGLFGSSYPRIRLRHARQSMDLKLVRQVARSTALKEVRVFLGENALVSEELLREFEERFGEDIFRDKDQEILDELADDSVGC